MLNSSFQPNSQLFFKWFSEFRIFQLLHHSHAYTYNYKYCISWCAYFSNGMLLLLLLIHFISFHLYSWASLFCYGIFFFFLKKKNKTKIGFFFFRFLLLFHISFWPKYHVLLFHLCFVFGTWDMYVRGILSCFIFFYLFVCFQFRKLSKLIMCAMLNLNKTTAH